MDVQPVTLTLLGPLSSASQNGVRPFFSCFLVAMGCYVLTRSWTYYLKHRRENQIPVFNVVFMSLVSLSLTAMGIWQIIRWLRRPT